MLGAEADLEAVIKVVWGCSMLLTRGGNLGAGWKPSHAGPKSQRKTEMLELPLPALY